ncbi:MAG: mersacidin/lichenicidin family type 2 lantibiotic [Hyalangium sp.]|uniref:mersacidin/lichenicidin family type 2 lantibiotic n=1 Tax=Hyalangium sp. TaxID=2028555 RepID=UPI00389A1682
MDTQTIIRAWKDPEFRALLSPEQRSTLPENPSGKSITELDDSELDDAVGGLLVQTRFYCVESMGICPTTTVLSRNLCVTTPVCFRVPPPP